MTPRGRNDPADEQSGMFRTFILRANVDESEAAVILNSDNFIMYINDPAAKLLGITELDKGKINMKNFIFQIDSYMKE